MKDATADAYVAPLVQPDARKTAALWADTRFIVIDTETTKPPKGTGKSLRVVSIAAVTCRKGHMREQWQWLIDPGCPIDPKSQTIHHISDDMVEGEPTFAARASDIIELFSEADGERRIIVGFNITFDIAVLRYELELLGLTIPPVTILDTRGALAVLAGIPSGVRSLAAVTGYLGITNTNPHEALGDAVATARVLIEEFERVAALDHTDIEDLLVTLGGPQTAQDVAAGAWIADRAGIGFVGITKEHAEEHSTVLPAAPSKKRLRTWEEQIGTCADLRCGHIIDAVIQSPAPSTVRLEVLERLLADRVTRTDAAGAATLTAALLPLLHQHHAAMSSRNARGAALRWAARWGPLFDSVTSCIITNDSDLCPACRDAEPCPIDLWHDTVARCSYRPHGRMSDAFFAANGTHANNNTYLRWIADGIDHRVADTGLWVMCEHLQAIGQSKSANMVAFHAVRTGCRHPAVVALCADGIAASSKLPRLHQAIALCNDVLTDRNDSTLEHWDRLAHRRDSFAGRAERLTDRFDLDPETGELVPRRRHEASRENARRRTGRFVVTGPTPVEVPLGEASAHITVEGDVRASFVEAINGSLIGSYNRWGIERWWHRRRHRLDGRTPIDIVTADDFDPSSVTANSVRSFADRLSEPMPEDDRRLAPLEPDA